MITWSLPPGTPPLPPRHGPPPRRARGCGRRRAANAGRAFSARVLSSVWTYLILSFSSAWNIWRTPTRQRPPACCRPSLPPAPRAPWRAASPGHPAVGTPLPPALQREASLRYDQALAWARFSYQQLRLLGVDPQQATQVLPPALRAPWTAVGSRYAWGRVCQACTAPTTPAELRRLTAQVAAALEEQFLLAWAELCAALAAPATP